MEEQNIIAEKQNHSNLKIIIIAIALILIAAIALVIVFSSPVPKDYKKLRQNLRDEDYEVESFTSREDALDTFAGALENMLWYDDEGLADEAYKMLENLYDLDENHIEEISKGLDCAVAAVDEDEENFLLVMYFDDNKSAKEFYGIFESIFEFIEKNGSDSYMFDEIKREDFVFGQKGKILYFGTKNALKACK